MDGTQIEMKLDNVGGPKEISWENRLAAVYQTAGKEAIETGVLENPEHIAAANAVLRRSYPVLEIKR